MAKTKRPEMAFDEKTGLYRKRLKDPATGKWVSVYGHTKEETRRRAREKEAELAIAADLRESPQLWTDARQWYELHTGGYSAKRREDYRNAINNHICPILGSKQIRDITYSDIQAVMADAAGASKSLQQKIDELQEENENMKKDMEKYIDDAVHEKMKDAFENWLNIQDSK